MGRVWSPRGDINYPLLVNVSAVRALESTRRSLYMDSIREGLQEGGQDGPMDVENASVVSCNAEDAFVRELDRRVSELSDRAMETRELTRLRDDIRDLLEKRPSNLPLQNWAVSVSRAMCQAYCSIKDAAKQGDGPFGQELDVRVRAVGVEMQKALDTALEPATEMLHTIDQRLADNYRWMRANSTLLGIHCSSETRCPVCLCRQVSMFIDPCGHTFCSTCIGKCDEHSCCICRGEIHGKRKLFWCG